MKILHANSYYKTNKLHSELVSTIDKLQLEQVVFIPLAENGDYKEIDIVESGNSRLIFAYCFKAWHRFIWPYKMFEILQMFKKVVAAHGPDLIHAHTAISNGLLALWAKKAFGIPYVVTVRNTDTDFFFKRLWIFRKLGLRVLEESSAIVLLSPIYRSEQLPRYFPEATHPSIYRKCVIAPNAIPDDWHLDQHIQNKPQSNTLIFVGRIDKNKNLNLIFSALRVLRDRGISLSIKIIGDGPDAEKAKLESSDINAMFYGRINDDSVLRKILRQADILVVPSFRETFGLVYVEAMSQGLPVIYTQGQGFDNFFPDGSVGFSVDPTDPEMLADRILQTYENYEAISKMAKSASADFTWSRTAGILQCLYKDAVKS